MNTPEENINDNEGSSALEAAVGSAVKTVLLAPTYGLNALLLHRLRQTVKSIVGICLGLEFALYLVWIGLGGAPQMASKPPSWDLGIVGPLVLVAYFMVSVALTPVWTASEVRQLTKNPHQLKLNNGKWTYGFSYRRSPWGVLSRKRKMKALQEGIFSDERTSLGLENGVYGRSEREQVIPKSHDRLAFRYQREAATHSLIFGSTGSGKSVTMQQLIRGDMLNHRSVVVVDFKNEDEVAQRLADWAQELDMDFYHFSGASSYNITNGNQCYWDPFAMADASSKPKRIEDLRTWDGASEHYRTTWDTLATNIFTMLDSAKREPSKASKAKNIAWGEGSLMEFHSAIKKGHASLIDLLAALDSTPYFSEAADFVRSIKSDVNRSRELSGIEGRLSSLMHKGYGKWMRASSDPKKNIDLFKLTSEGRNVVLFSLDARQAQEVAAGIGAMLMAELDSVSSRRSGQVSNELSIYIDEAQNVAPEKLLGLFTMARSSRMALTIAQQTLEQFEATAASGESFRKLLFNTVDNFIVHAGSGQTTGEIFADIVGKTMVTKVRGSSQGPGQSNGMGYSDEEEWVVNPSVFVNLKKPTRNGSPEAIIINKKVEDPAFKRHSGPLARKVWMTPAHEVLAPVHVVAAPRQQLPTIYEEPVQPVVEPLPLKVTTVEKTMRDEVPVPEQVRGMIRALKTGDLTKAAFAEEFRALTGKEVNKENLLSFLPQRQTTPQEPKVKSEQALPSLALPMKTGRASHPLLEED